MKRLHLLLWIILPLFSSCFEALEEIDFNDDNSGTFTFTLNMSQSKLEIATLKKLDSIKGFKVPTNAEITNHFRRIDALMENSEGISNADYSLDFENYIAIVKVDFDSLKALSNAFKSTYKTMSGKDLPLKDDIIQLPYGMERLSFIADYGILGKLDDKKKEGLAKATYTSVYRFTKPVESLSNKSAKISSNKKAVFLQSNLTEILKKEKTISNKIILSK